MVTVEHTSKEEVPLTYEAARSAVLQACEDIGACVDHSDPSIRLAPGARMDFPVSVPIDAAGVPCAWDALPRTDP